MSDIKLTRRAVAHFQKVLQQEKGAIGVRVGVKPAGCSGLSYVLGVAKAFTQEDKIFETDGIQLIVDKEAFSVLQGMEIDWVQEGLNEYVQFNNPNVKGACGCGESFTV